MINLRSNIKAYLKISLCIKRVSESNYFAIEIRNGNISSFSLAVILHIANVMKNLAAVQFDEHWALFWDTLCTLLIMITNCDNVILTLIPIVAKNIAYKYSSLIILCTYVKFFVDNLEKCKRSFF